MPGWTPRSRTPPRRRPRRRTPRPTRRACTPTQSARWSRLRSLGGLLRWRPRPRRRRAHARRHPPGWSASTRTRAPTRGRRAAARSLARRTWRGRRHRWGRSPTATRKSLRPRRNAGPAWCARARACACARACRDARIASGGVRTQEPPRLTGVCAAGGPAGGPVRPADERLQRPCLPRHATLIAHEAARVDAHDAARVCARRHACRLPTARGLPAFRASSVLCALRTFVTAAGPSGGALAGRARLRTARCRASRRARRARTHRPSWSPRSPRAPAPRRSSVAPSGRWPRTTTWRPANTVPVGTRPASPLGSRTRPAHAAAAAAADAGRSPIASTCRAVAAGDRGSLLRDIARARAPGPARPARLRQPRLPARQRTAGTPRGQPCAQWRGNSPARLTCRARRAEEGTHRTAPAGTRGHSALRCRPTGGRRRTRRQSSPPTGWGSLACCSQTPSPSVSSAGKRASPRPARHRRGAPRERRVMRRRLFGRSTCPRDPHGRDEGHPGYSNPVINAGDLWGPAPRPLPVPRRASRAPRRGVRRAQLPRSRQLSAAPARQSAGCRRPFYARNGPRGLHPRHPRCAPAPTPTPQKRGVAPGLSAANNPLCCPVPHQPQVAAERRARSVPEIGY